MNDNIKIFFSKLNKNLNDQINNFTNQKIIRNLVN